MRKLEKFKLGEPVWYRNGNGGWTRATVREVIDRRYVRVKPQIGLPQVVPVGSVKTAAQMKKPVHG